MNKEPAVEVRLTRTAPGPWREPRTYVLIGANEIVREWFFSDRPALLALAASLEKLGFVQAADPAAAAYQIVVQLGFASRPVVERVENPDSIRYQNVAAIVGEGRYKQILTERDDAVGSLLVGPNGEMVPTGGWKQAMADSQPKEVRSVGSHDVMILRAWDVAGEPASPRSVAWELTVLRANDLRTPSPQHVGSMIRQAAERLAAGWVEDGGKSAAAGASPSPRPPAPEAGP